ncbi:hypothetical protein [Kordia jejudonensis]|uniref:hypothetical protein n=1 Tax=Kordia jejudonensis TaxID=1348245 RepID=UPI000629663B|nr:hypothetical protein [Kordia jejudonensis]
MKIKLVFVCLFFLIIACGNDKKETETPTETSETVQVTTKVESSKPKTVDEHIAEIKENFAKIESQQASYTLKSDKEDIGGGVLELQGYFNGNTPVKIVKGAFGEHGSVKTTYYFNENTLFFVFQEKFSEATMRGPFTKKENRFYIADGKLIRVLEKEQTITSGDFKMDNAQNIDVTEAWKNETYVVANFTKLGREVSSLLLEKSIGLDNGRWISTEDSNTGVEIKDGKFIMFYQSETISSNDVYDYKLTEHEGVEYLTLIDETGDKLEYSILEYTDEIFVISYLARGNRLTYEKEK